ncbi:sensor histidine kinase [Amycolatopsis aidingensis]|uniref:sensor histidine kinase n=1 Tax=Amycolatopsis aidingensis TaxID=2842453 RepID=UPI001C0B756A|nr:sensor histidine kinase [Amycolatopsis aidingensis]
MGNGQGPRRALVIDSLLGATVSVTVAVAITVDIGGSRGPDAVAYLFAVCLGALMLVRRQFPVLALTATAVGLLAYYAAGYPTIGLALPVAAALYSAAEAGRLSIAVATAGLLTLVSVGFRIREGEDPAYLLGVELASTFGLMAVAIALGGAVRATRLLRAEQERSARRAAEEREREARRRVEEERLRIARELHDVLAHTVAVVSVQADVATESIADDPEAARAALSVIRMASDEAVRDLQNTLSLLRDPHEADGRSPTGSIRHLDALAETMAGSGLAVEVKVEGEAPPLPAVVDTTAYRIVQESLTNALQHANASRVAVTLRYDDQRLRITVCDDGTGGADATAGTGRGIRGMRERASLLGGRVDVSSQPGAGFRVEASLPLEVRS